MLYSTKSKMEYRANMFAAELLIEDEQMVEMAEDGMTTSA
jgi:Zn-dependent peptidase ImmA (M78 family)